MKIAAVTRFKQGDLFSAMQRLGWSQRKFAEKAGIRIEQLNNVMNLKRKPTLEQAQKIQAALAEEGEFVDVINVFPKTFAGFDKAPVLVQLADMNERQLSEFQTHQQLQIEDSQIPLPSRVFEDKDLLQKLLLVLTEKERQAIQLHIGEGLTYAEIGVRLGRSGEQINQRCDKALRKLRRALARMEETPSIPFGLLTAGAPPERGLPVARHA